MIPRGPEQQGEPGGSYLVIVAIVIGVSAGIALASVTREAYFIMGGLVAGAIVAIWLSRRSSGS